MRHAALGAILGRRWSQRPEAGRVQRADVRTFLRMSWAGVDRLLPEANLARLPTFGNRNNVLLAVLTVAGYHALLDMGIDRITAAALCADVGWKIYASMLWLPALFAKIATRDPQRRINLVLRMVMRFPFSAPGSPGYAVKAWREFGGSHTHFTHCPPWTFVENYVAEHGDRGEAAAFRASWCSYDWAAADLMSGRRAAYTRSRTLSSGDAVCDMRWSAEAPPNPSEKMPLISIARPPNSRR